MVAVSEISLFAWECDVSRQGDFLMGGYVVWRSIESLSRVTGPGKCVSVFPLLVQKKVVLPKVFYY